MSNSMYGLLLIAKLFVGVKIVQSVLETRKVIILSILSALP